MRVKWEFKQRYKPNGKGMGTRVEAIVDRAGAVVALLAAIVFAHAAFGQTPSGATSSPGAEPATTKPANANDAMKSQSVPTATPPAPAHDVAPLPPVPPGYGAKKAVPEKPAKMVDLNNASKAELMTLPSVGEAEAIKIIANRPYVSKVDLVTKAGLPEGVYLAVRHKVVVNDIKKKPAAKNAAQQN